MLWKSAAGSGAAIASNHQSSFVVSNINFTAWKWLYTREKNFSSNFHIFPTKFIYRKITHNQSTWKKKIYFQLFWDVPDTEIRARVWITSESWKSNQLFQISLRSAAVTHFLQQSSYSKMASNRSGKSDRGAESRPFRPTSHGSKRHKNQQIPSNFTFNNKQKSYPQTAIVFPPSPPPLPQSNYEHNW